MYSHLIGNEQIKQAFNRMVESGRVGHSFLFAGREGIGKSLFAEGLAKHLLGIENVKTHPDVHHLRVEGKIGLHSIEALRAFQKEIHLPPYQGSWKVFIVHEADRMLPTSANALLKSFEEPPKQTLIILLSSSPEEILPTILSRCIKVYFQPLTQEEIISYLVEKRGIVPEKAQKAAKRAEGSLGHALSLCNEARQGCLEELLAYFEGERGYLQIKSVCHLLGEHFEALRKGFEEEAQQLYSREWLKTLSAVQREGYEKEWQGVVSLRISQEVCSLFEGVLAYFRDALLPQERRCFTSSLQLEEGDFFKIQKSVQEALLSIERFIPLSSVLESWLLKLESFL